jgi:hypothetical protein
LDQNTLDSAVTEAYNAILGTTPFNLTRARPNWLAVYSYHTGVDGLGNDAIQSLLANLDLPHELFSTTWKAKELCQGTVISLHKATGGDPIQGDLLDPLDESYIATAVSLDTNWTQVVLRVLGRALGLGDEFERDDTEDESFVAPTIEQEIQLEIHANLIVGDAPSAGPPSTDLRWYWFLTASERSRDLEIVPHPDPGAADRARYTDDPTSDVRLIEGGGGFRTGVWRSAQDCLMRREIGSDDLSPMVDDVGFCRVCVAYLTMFIFGMLEAPPYRDLHSQTLLIDDVTWSALSAPKTSGFPFSDSIPILAPDPHWEASFEVGPAVGGLRFSGLECVAQPHSDRGEEVCEAIEFADLAVTFSDGTTAAFDMTSAFARGATFQTATSGKRSANDTNYAWGCKLTTEDDFGGTCRVRVELSLVVKHGFHDFEPGGIATAAKFYPQIAMTWFDGGTRRVRSMTGTVKLVINNRMTRGAVDEPWRGNVASLFTDSNLSILDSTLGRRKSILDGLPNWWLVFDYCRPNIRKEVCFLASRPWSVGTWEWRAGYCTWPPTTSSILTVGKHPGQVAYDNVHAHGMMHEDPNAPLGLATDTVRPMVHAPACAEACFHLHWRWSAFNYYLATLRYYALRTLYDGATSSDAITKAMAVNPHSPMPVHARLLAFYPGIAGLRDAFGPPAPRAYQYLGWGEQNGRPVASIEPDAPLIPPNQMLHVAVTQPATTRSAVDAMRALITGTDRVVDGTQVLDWAEKAIWYMVDIEDPVAGERQVILEQGCGFAYEYFGLPDIAEEMTFMAVYMSIRWHKDLSPVQQQVPDGTQALAKFGDPTAMTTPEDL